MAVSAYEAHNGIWTHIGRGTHILRYFCKVDGLSEGNGCWMVNVLLLYDDPYANPLGCS